MSDDRDHFESYREQTRVKHEIVEKYLFAYFNILKPTHNKLVYIDGFAGPGHYQNGSGGERIEGSPLRALRLIAKYPDLQQRVSCMFIEKDRALASPLEEAVATFCRENPKVRTPHVFQGEFAGKVRAVLDDIAQRRATLAPTFLFVDPCGVDGASFDPIKSVLAQNFAEALIFFNIDGVKRIASLQKLGDTLPSLLGSQERADELQKLVQSAESPADKEQRIIAYYSELIVSSTPAKYVARFRVEKDRARATSHYLIHVTRHPRAFAIMKDVMWKLGQTSEGMGGLAFEQASLRGTGSLFRPEWENVKASVMTELRTYARKQVPLTHFYEVLVQRRDNSLSTPAYRTALLELEAADAVRIYNKDGIAAPAASRRKQAGAVTLSATHYAEAIQ